jgi:hypothetical protein
MPSLFEAVVGACGLSVLLARGAMRRACERSGITDPEKMNRHELLRALPEIETTLGTFLTPDEVKERMAALLQLTRSLSSGLHAIRLEDDKLDED